MDRLVPIARLATALLEFLKEGPRTTDELCSRFGYSGSAIRCRLQGLEEDCLIHHQKLVYTNGGGTYYVWHAGIRTTTTVERPALMARKPERPPIVIARDPLVAALFGAPAAQQQRNHP